MEKNTKILIGVGLGIVAAYFVYSKSKNKLASTTSHQGSDSSDDLAISCEKEYNDKYAQLQKSHQKEYLPAKEVFIEKCKAQRILIANTTQQEREAMILRESQSYK